MTGVFEMMTGPYIPTEHVPLDVLPWNREEGYEVFSYPPEISDVDEALFEAEGLDRDSTRKQPRNSQTRSDSSSSPSSA